MARTIESIQASKPGINRAKMEATTEADIERHAREDGSETVGLLDGFRRRPGQRGPGKRPPMVTMNLRVSEETRDRWRARGPGWQKEARAVLETSVGVAASAAGPGRKPLARG